MQETANANVRTGPLFGTTELSARKHIQRLFDPGTFTEIDAKAHHRSQNFGLKAGTLPGDGVV